MSAPAKRIDRLQGVVLVLIVLVIGAMAGAASFTHVHDFTMDNSPPGTADWLGWANAVISELVPTASLIYIARRRRVDPRAGIKYPMSMLVAAVVVSLTAQLAVAVQTPFGWLVSALPALAFLGLSKLVFTATKAQPDQPHTTATPHNAAVPVPVPVPSAPAAVPNAVPGVPATLTAQPAPAQASPSHVDVPVTVPTNPTRPVDPAPPVAPPAPVPTPAVVAPRITPVRTTDRQAPSGARPGSGSRNPRTRPSKPTPPAAPLAPSTTDTHVSASDAAQLELPMLSPDLLARAARVAKEYQTEHGTPINAGQLAWRLKVPSNLANQALAVLNLDPNTSTPITTVNGSPSRATR